MIMINKLAGASVTLVSIFLIALGHSLWAEILILAKWAGLFLIFCGGVAVLGGLTLLSDLIYDKIDNNRVKKERDTLDLARLGIENDNARIHTITAGIDEQLWIGSPEDSSLVFKPLHLSPGLVNGKTIQPTPSQMRFWAKYQELHSTASKPNVTNATVAELPATTAELKPILDYCLESERLIIAGRSGAGKSEFSKHLLTGHQDADSFMVINPHAPNLLFDSSFPVVGSNQDYLEIDGAFDYLMKLFDDRFTLLAEGAYGECEFPKLVVYIDELKAILDTLPHRVQTITKLFRESRKLSFYMILMTQTLNTSDLGMTSADRANCDLVQMLGGKRGDSRRCFVVPEGVGIGLNNMGKWDEYSSAGVYRGGGYQPQNIITPQPPSEVDAIKKMLIEGMSGNQIIETMGGNRQDRLDQIRSIKASS